MLPFLSNARQIKCDQFFFGPHEYYSITRRLTSLEQEVDFKKKKKSYRIFTSELCWVNSYRQLTQKISTQQLSINIKRDLQSN
jgi:hypothetical protein